MKIKKKERDLVNSISDSYEVEINIFENTVYYV